MNRALSAMRLDPSTADWPVQLREMRRQLAERPTLIAHHFLEVVLPKIGGACIALFPSQTDDAKSPCGYAFLLPRDISAEGPVYTLRYEHVDGSPAAGSDEITSAVEKVLPPGQRTHFYRPGADQRYTQTHIDLEGVDCGHPDAAEAAAIRTMQQAIWHSPPDGLYPSDLHSDDAGLGSSLVARVDGALAGFLLGFFRFCPDPTTLPLQNYGQDLQLESQLLAVAPGRRRRRIGQLLKRLQARQALAMGIDLISWTTDPLLFANGLLNFTRLRAVACEFQPSLYPFRNELNRVTAARLSLLWPVRSRRVQRALQGDLQPGPYAVESDPDLTVVNQANSTAVLDAAGARIAIEIPADWVALQRQDRQAAQRWRDITNLLLDCYLGTQEGQYIITNTGVSGSRRYLIGERVESKLLDSIFALPD